MTELETKIREFLKKNHAQGITVLEKYTFNRAIYPWKTSQEDVQEILAKMTQNNEITISQSDDTFLSIKQLKK